MPSFLEYGGIVDVGADFEAAIFENIDQSFQCIIHCLLQKYIAILWTKWLLTVGSGRFHKKLLVKYKENLLKRIERERKKSTHISLTTRYTSVFRFLAAFDTN